MSPTYPGNELSVEQLVHALARTLDLTSPLRKKFLELEPQKICGIERDLSEVLQAIRTVKNTTLPVNRFPPEVLSGVLEYRTYEQDLVAATHVCQYWRSTLISTPSLWTCFQFHSSYDLDRTLTYLERSKSAPIDVSVNPGMPQGPEVLKCLAPHIMRTRSLIIQGFHGIHAASFLFCNPAPSLQHLEVVSSEHSVRLPENFLGQQAPLLRSVNFNGICPTFESPFPLPNLADFYLRLPEGAGPFRMSALFQFFYSSPQLQKVHINISHEVLQDIPLDKVISLESLVELNYICHSAGRVLPCLKLPRLKRLLVSSSSGPGQIQKLADILPYGGHLILAGATKMSYHSNQYSFGIGFPGNEVEVSLCIFREIAADPITVDWFSDQTWIPFGQIEDLKVEAYPIAGDPSISVFALENLRVLRITLHDTRFTEGFLRMFHPDPGAGIPCRSLQEIEYFTWGSPRPYLSPLIDLVRERKQAGYQLGLVCIILFAQEPDGDLGEELREYVGEVRVKVSWDGKV